MALCELPIDIINEVLDKCNQKTLFEISKTNNLLFELSQQFIFRFPVKFNWKVKKYNMQLATSFINTHLLDDDDLNIFQNINSMHIADNAKMTFNTLLKLKNLTDLNLSDVAYEVEYEDEDDE